MKKQTTKRSSKTESAPTAADDATKNDAPEKKRSRRPNVRERLVLAALDEVEEVGFARFSLRHVATACDVSTAAPYKHFRNKREIIEAVLRYINSDWLRRQDAVLRKYADEPIRRRLVELSLEFIRFMYENPQFRSVLMIRGDTFDAEYLKIKATLSAKSKEIISEYCELVGMPARVAKIKMYVVRSLIYGASLMFSNGELVYDDYTMGFVRAAIDREFDLPWELETPDIGAKAGERGIAEGRPNAFPEK